MSLRTRTGYNSGIDWFIDRLIRNMYPFIQTAFSITDDTAYECYGRIQRIKDKELGWVPVWFKDNTTTGKDYKEVLWDDSKIAISFFHVKDKKNDPVTEVATATVHLYFFCNLNKLIPTSTGREDEIVSGIIYDLVDNNNGFGVTAMPMGIENILGDFGGAKEGFEMFNEQPYCCFRIEGAVSYQNGVTYLNTAITNF